MATAPKRAGKRVNKNMSQEEPQAADFANLPDLAHLSDFSDLDEPDTILVDLSTSCTTDVAVAKLLGWMRGPIRRVSHNMEEDNFTIDQVAYIDIQGRPLADLLTHFRASAQRRHFEAFEAGDSDDVLAPLSTEVALCDDTIYKAAQYMRDIHDELNKDANCTLQIDAYQTAQSGERRITLSSLNKWATKKYGISVAEDYVGVSAKTQKNANIAVPMPNEGSFDEAMLIKPMETAYASFGFLMAAFAASRSDFRIKERLNVSRIAGKIVDQLSHYLQEPIDGQTTETMRKTFSRSIQAMDSKLRQVGGKHEAFLLALVAEHEGKRKLG